jgi:hypothetical protein
MSGVATAIGGSALLGAVTSSNAANTQAGAINSANNLNASEFATQQKNEAPYQAAGVQALGQLQNPAFEQNFNAQMFQQSPGYQFSLQQGQNALNAANAATGNQVSGAGLAALSNYNVGSANNEYQQAFNNYQTQQQGNFGRLATIAGMGAGANAQSNAAAQNYGNQTSSNMVGAGNAAAASQIGIGNAISQGITGVAGNLNAPAPASSGYSTMSQFAGSPASNLQNPSSTMFAPPPSSGGYSLGN